MLRLKIEKLKPDLKQREVISEIWIDIGKLFFAGGVVGFFIPGISGKINLGSFLITLLISLACFIIGVKLARKKRYYYDY